MFKFVADSVGGVGAKRKFTHKSCEPCKKRHKRCSHAGASESSRSSEKSHPHPSTETTHHGPEKSASLLNQPDNSPGISNHATSHPLQLGPPRNLSDDSYLRFIGDLSPEASFLSNGGREDGAEKGSRHENVGVWLGQKPENRGSSHDDFSGINPLPMEPFSLTCLRTLSPYLQRECMSVLPSERDFKFLFELYYARFDPIFPILHDVELERYSPIEKTALKQCICLVAALDPQVKEHLRLPHTKDLLSPTKFRACIASALKQSLDMEFMQNKMVVLKVYALMAFYVDRPQCSDVSTNYAAQAVHYSQTLGLHVGWPNDDAKGEESRRAFWCVWVLDRLNAAANGRPVLIHSRDMDNQVTESASTQSPAFSLLIKITHFLDRVISKYRPHSASSQQIPDEYPSFEDLVTEADAGNIGNSLLASLDILHSAIVILWDRPKHVEGGCQQKSSSSIRLFNAGNIVSLASEELGATITRWPILPYAMSMATSVAYKSLRSTNISYKRKQAYKIFYNSCEILEELGNAFLSARTMAKLAKETMQEVERIAADKRRPVSSDGRQTEGQLHESIFQSTANSTDHPEVIRQEGTPLESNQSQPVGSMSQTISSDIEPPGQDVGILDYFMGHDEIFDDLDPSFDISRIDAVFSANLDPTISLQLEDWTSDSNLW